MKARSSSGSIKLESIKCLGRASSVTQLRGIDRDRITVGRVKIAIPTRGIFLRGGAGLVRSYRIRLNHRTDSNAETSPVSAAAAANRALIPTSFFSSENRVLSDS